MADILRKHFIVVSDPYAVQNNVSFGVAVWTYTADSKELRKYWWGTGNCLIGRTCTGEYHGKRVKEMTLMLTEVLQIATGKLRAAEEITGTVTSVDADQNTLTISRGFGKDAKEQTFKLSKETRIVDGISEVKDVVALKDGLRSELVERGASVRIATLTDRDGQVILKELRITAKSRLKK